MALSFILLGISLLISSHISAQETYENSTNLCQRCKCKETSKNFELNCQSQGFHHMIANWPQHNTTLIVSFSNNKIVNLEQLPDSDFVTKVILSHCGIESLDNGAFKAVKNLKYLDLSYNMLKTEKISPEKFKGVYNNTVYEPLAIEDLDLSYNQIHSLPHNIFEHLITLKQLNLEGNQLRVLDHPTQVALSDLTNLQVLNLANNQLTELVGDAIRNLQNLRILYLSMNKLDFVPETLQLLSRSLEEVYLDNNPIFEITDESFLGVKGIKTLSLTNLKRLENVKANSFAHLKNLSILFLSNNPSLTTIDRDAFGEHRNLEELYLDNSSLLDLHYNLTNWNSLRRFNLTDNNLICDCDLYKISVELRSEIKRNKDGPVCINPITDRSMMIYELTKDACEFDEYISRTSHIIEHHFRTIKLIFIIMLSILTMASVVVVIIVFLKYRRYRMNRNYPFITQVTYNPLRNPNIN